MKNLWRIYEGWEERIEANQPILQKVRVGNQEDLARVKKSGLLKHGVLSFTDPDYEKFLKDIKVYHEHADARKKAQAGETA